MASRSISSFSIANTFHIFSESTVLSTLNIKSPQREVGFLTNVDFTVILDLWLLRNLTTTFSFSTNTIEMMHTFLQIM